jgi:hypothetical protein
MNLSQQFTSTAPTHYLRHDLYYVALTSQPPHQFVCPVLLLLTVGNLKKKKVRGCIQKFPNWVIRKYMLTTINTRWEATQTVMAAKLTRLTQKIATQLHLVVENCAIWSSRSTRLVRTLLDTPPYQGGIAPMQQCSYHMLWTMVNSFKAFLWGGAHIHSQTA